MATRVHLRISHLKMGLRIAILLTLLLLLTSCGRAYTVNEPTVAVLDQGAAVGLLQYLENLEEGPAYAFSVEVPEAWVGNFALRNEGNKLSFDYLSGDDALPAPVFSIMALSRNQFWDQVGGYPGQYGDIVFTGDTYFVYQLPAEAHYSGLPEDVYDELAAQVPSVVSTFQVEATP